MRQMFQLLTVYHSKVRTSLPIALTVAILGLILVDRVLFHTAPAEAGPYHAAVADAAQALPTHVGSWLGSDAQVPQAAIRLLHPNVILSRHYRNVTSGRTITFLLVQCQDARDLMGHYPPVCYVNQGWTLDVSKPAEWSVDDWNIHATRYEFTSSRIDQGSRLRINNFMVLPTGDTCPDMKGITALAKDPHKKFFGAAQVQFVSDPDLPIAEREEFEQNLIRAARPLFDRIRAGVRP